MPLPSLQTLLYALAFAFGWPPPLPSRLSAIILCSAVPPLTLVGAWSGGIVDHESMIPFRLSTNANAGSSVFIYPNVLLCTSDPREVQDMIDVPDYLTLQPHALNP